MRIKNTRKLSFLIMWLLHIQLLRQQKDMGFCEPLWSIRLNWRRSKWCTYCAAVSVHTHGCLPHQKMKRKTSEPSKSQLYQAGWNWTILKFGLENPLNVHNYLSILLFIVPWSHDLEKVTSLLVWLGVRRTSTVEYGPLVLKNVRLLAIEYVKTSVDKKTSPEKSNPCSNC